jgi:hypothetical protein
MTALSPAVSRLAAVGLLILLFLVTVRLVVVPLVTRAQLASTSLADARFALARLEAIAAVQPEAEAGPAPVDVLARLLLTEPTVQAALARLQTETSARITGAGMRVSAMQALPAETRGPVAVLRLAVVAEGPERAVISALAALEKPPPPLFLTRSRITAVAGSPTRLEIEVSGFWSPLPEAAPK